MIFPPSFHDVFRHYRGKDFSVKLNPVARGLDFYGLAAAPCPEFVDPEGKESDVVILWGFAAEFPDVRKEVAAQPLGISVLPSVITAQQPLVTV